MVLLSYFPTAFKIIPPLSLLILHSDVFFPFSLGKSCQWFVILLAFSKKTTFDLTNLLNFVFNFILLFCFSYFSYFIISLLTEFLDLFCYSFSNFKVECLANFFSLSSFLNKHFHATNLPPNPTFDVSKKIEGIFGIIQF